MGWIFLSNNDYTNLQSNTALGLVFMGDIILFLFITSERVKFLLGVIFDFLTNFITIRFALIAENLVLYRQLYSGGC